MQEAKSYSQPVQDISYSCRMDSVRKLIEAVVKERDLNMSQLSKDIGKNHAYLQQFIKRGVPTKLDEDVRAQLAERLGVDEALLKPGADHSRREMAVGEFEAAPAKSRQGTRLLSKGAVAEIDVVAGAGGGGYALPSSVTDGKGVSYAADAVRAEWVMPAEYLREELQVSLGSAEIVRIRGDSMAPLLAAGDRVLIDRRDTKLRQGGIFAVRDADEVIVKQVALVRDVEPPRIQCISSNTSYAPFELVLDGESVEIIGRVVCRISRM